jgi:hypothetical protein
LEAEDTTISFCHKRSGPSFYFHTPCFLLTRLSVIANVLSLPTTVLPSFLWPNIKNAKLTSYRRRIGATFGSPGMSCTRKTIEMQDLRKSLINVNKCRGNPHCTVQLLVDQHDNQTMEELSSWFMKKLHFFFQPTPKTCLSFCSFFVFFQFFEKSNNTVSIYLLKDSVSPQGPLCSFGGQLNWVSQGVQATHLGKNI